MKTLKTTTNTICEELYQKYDRPGPRYTSYPAYPHWEMTPSASQWLHHLETNENLEIDLYIHIPYCQSLCFYCGCNRNISKNLDLGDVYTTTLLKEWEMYTQKLPNLKVSSLHFGGGTPTFLKTAAFKKIFDAIRPFRSENFHGAIEIDPRVTTREQIEYLSSQGVKRFSLGIQDFNHEVQKVINRIQPREMVEDILQILKDNGAQSINFDLIYGLPKQSEQSLIETMDIVKELRPDTIALYSYAHVPWKAPAQKALEKHGIAEGQEKRELYNISKKLLDEVGYKELGLDHFSLESDKLYKACKSGEMKRSFMGYTTYATENLIGLGVSAISSTPYGHIQNEKEIPDYMAKVEKGELPFFYGHIQNERDLETSKTIHDIMCGKSAGLDQLFKVSPFDQIDKIKRELESMAKDLLICPQSLAKEKIEVTHTGLPFLRNIAMSLDYRLKDTHRFSRTV